MNKLFFIATFTATLFGAAPAFAFDADLDGIDDSADAFPCDKAAAGAAFVPAQGEHGLLLFENKWPDNGDLDFNDLVLSYNFIFRLDAAGRVVSMRATFNPLALGAHVDHGLAIHLPVDARTVSHVSKTLGRGGVTTQIQPSTQDAELTFTIADDLRELFGANEEDHINTRPERAAIVGTPIEVEINFASAVPLPVSGTPYDIFIFRTADHRHEIHLPDFAGTANMDTSLFGQRDDGSSATRHFVNRNGLPFVLNIPTLAEYPLELEEISRLYPRIVDFAASGGVEARDFYLREVKLDKAYRDVHGNKGPSPVFVGDDHIPAATGCIKDWGLAVDFGKSRNVYAYGSGIDKDGRIVVTGYVQGSFPGFTNAGGLDAFVAKYDAATGRELWARQLGGPNDETGRAIHFLANGDILITGETRSNLVSTNAGGSDAWVMRVRGGDGIAMWGRQFGGSGNESGYGVTVDRQNNVIVAGGSTSTNFANATYPGNTPTAFVVKFNGAGTRLWTRQFIPDTGDTTNYGYALAIDADQSNGDLYVAGSERRYSEAGNAAENQFVSRLNSTSGAVTWSHHVGDYGYRVSDADQRYAFAYGVSVDQFDHSVYVTGHWYAGTSVSSWGDWSRAHGDDSADATLSKLSANGVRLWTQTLASVDGGHELGQAVRSGGVAGAIYFSGRTGGSLEGLESQGLDDYYLAAYDRSGRRLWITQNGTPENDSGYIASVSPLSQSTGLIQAVGNTAGLLGSDDASHWDITIENHDMSTGAPVSSVIASRLTWRTGPWSACSTTCGVSGSRTRTVQCERANGTVVADSFCLGARPATTASCWNELGCLWQQRTTPWSTCSSQCGQGTQSRSVVCLNTATNQAGPESNCLDLSSVGAVYNRTQNCANYSNCSFAWYAGDWSSCSAQCNGTRERSVFCRRSDGAAAADASCTGARPSTTETCSAGLCSAATCSSLRAGGISTSGTYQIDPDGAGPRPASDAYCDMTAMGGGWTNLDFSTNRVLLQNGSFISCTRGLEATDSSITCQGPRFNNDPGRPLFQYFCDGSDRSADYLLDHVAPLLGHRSAGSLGFSSLQQVSTGIDPSVNLDEYCYINGAVVRWDDPACAAYVPVANANGNCTPTYFTLRR